MIISESCGVLYMTWEVGWLSFWIQLLLSMALPLSKLPNSCETIFLFVPWSCFHSYLEFYIFLKCINIISYFLVCNLEVENSWLPNLSSSFGTFTGMSLFCAKLWYGLDFQPFFNSFMMKIYWIKNLSLAWAYPTL